MCTAMAYQTKDHYFGRNLDLDCSYGETVTVTPRHYLFAFRQAPAMPRHYAIIGMAHLAGGYPLYYDATNEAGLSMAGLNFPGNAVYRPAARGKDNVTPFELIPWILGQCASLGEARRLLDRVNLLGLAFRPDKRLWALEPSSNPYKPTIKRDGVPKGEPSRFLSRFSCKDPQSPRRKSYPCSWRGLL